jgi:hypothetical protein
VVPKRVLDEAAHSFASGTLWRLAHIVWHLLGRRLLGQLIRGLQVVGQTVPHRSVGYPARGA